MQAFELARSKFLTIIIGVLQVWIGCSKNRESILGGGEAIKSPKTLQVGHMYTYQGQALCHLKIAFFVRDWIA
jgi:hypothetical protein